MNKKIGLITIGVGLVIALLVTIISLSLYGKVYFFDGYGITVCAWVASIASVAGGIGLIICGDGDGSSSTQNTSNTDSSSNNNVSDTNNYSSQSWSKQRRRKWKPGFWTWVIAILLLGYLLNMCDGRSETEKWEDSFKGAYREYAKFYGWD